MSLSGKIFGLIFILAGLVLVWVAIFSSLWVLVYGIPVLALGIWMIFNKSEDEIEQRKDEKNLNKKITKN